MSRRWGVGELLDALSTPPDRTWPAGALHHGSRILLLVLLALTVHLLFPVSPVPDIPVLEKGMVADKDIVARVGFPIYKSDEELSRERTEAAASVPPIFDYDPGAADSLATRARAFFASADSAATAGGGTQAEERRLAAVLAAAGIPASPDGLEVLRSARARRLIFRSLTLVAREDLPAGVAATASLNAARSPQIRLRRDGREQLVSREAIHTPTWLYERAALRLPLDAPQGAAELQRLLLIRFLQPNLRLNQDATEVAQRRAAQAVTPIAGQVLQGEKVVGAHERIGDEERQRLRSYRDELTRLGGLEGGRVSHLRSAGALLFDLFTLLIFGLLVRLYRPSVYEQYRHLLLQAFLAAALIAIAALISRAHAPTALIPIALPILIVAVLWDGRVALTLALVLSILLAGQAAFLGMTALFTMAMGGAAAALSVRVVRRRAQTWVFIAVIAGAYIAAAVTLGLQRSLPLDEIFWSALWGTINATGSALVAMGLLPLLESFSGITTDQTLLELADMNRPLLRRLALEAPGTYAHSVSVANLTEAAARAIDANPLLARVGTYYHDVGKTAKPQYFIENQPPGRNPHDRLKPATSAAIVRGHVTEGLRLAEQYKLPDSVRAFIREHHGTQAIGFFLEQARELAGEAEVNTADFAYPGPRPRSKETGLLMLADAVESAARVLQDPTPERIRALVDRIVDNKIAQGQLDDCPLTMGEIARAKQEFAAVLTGMFHHRIDYPHLREPPAVGAPRPAAPGASGAPGPPADGGDAPSPPATIASADRTP